MVKTMKKILFISDQYISDVIGGSLGHRRFYDILSDQKEYDFKIISLDENLKNSIKINIKKDKKMDYLSRIYFHSSFLCFYTDKICEAAFKFQPDVVIIGRSRLGFIAKRLRELLSNAEIISNFDNIEYDYVTSQFAQKTGLIGKVIKIVEKYIVKRDEKECIESSDKYIFLTDRDKKRAEEIYNINTNNRSYIFPISLKNAVNLEKESTKINIFFIGNLKYAANIKSILWFLKNVWFTNYINDNNIVLNIAGKNADTVLREYRNFNNIKIFSDFNKVTDIIPKGALFIAPIVTGAGMKVKIAEALSMGLPIIGTTEALVGYEEAANYLKDKGFLVKADSADEYKHYIDYYKMLNKKAIKTFESNNKFAFNLFYSYKRAKNILKIICD